MYILCCRHHVRLCRRGLGFRRALILSADDTISNIRKTPRELNEGREDPSLRRGMPQWDALEECESLTDDIKDNIDVSMGGC